MTQPHSDLGCDWPTKGRGSPSGACVLPHTGVTKTFSVMITSWPRPFKMTSRGDVCGSGGVRPCANTPPEERHRHTCASPSDHSPQASCSVSRARLPLPPRGTRGPRLAGAIAYLSLGHVDPSPAPALSTPPLTFNPGESQR